MSTQGEYFAAGIRAGKLLGAKMLLRGQDHPQFARREAELRAVLQELGVTFDGPISFESGDLEQQVHSATDRVSSRCFESGMELALLQLHLQSFSLFANQSNFPAEEVAHAINALKPLVRQLRLRAVEIGTSNLMDPLLQQVSEALSDPGRIVSASSDLAEESEFVEARVRSYLETKASISKHATAARPPESAKAATKQKVFLVHGHDHGVKESVARYLEHLGLKPIILHEQPNAGRTVIEKFSDYADVEFAVVLLTGDDLGKVRDSKQELQMRARQNVILELGYFLGKLGRTHVCVLFESGVEIPSDYQGILFLPLDSSDRWKFDLIRELRTAGFDVDLNRVFS